MFWGVTLESGKRYSQKVSESYHLSMASLETLPNDAKPANKEVSVMIEHGESEYVLCTLEYGRVMQVNLDIIFDCGEIVTYFLNGEGTVHLTGYALAETEDANDTLDKSTDMSALIKDCDEEEGEDEDWTPAKEKQKMSDSDDDSEESEDEDSDIDTEPDDDIAKRNKIDLNELSATNEDEDTDGDRERQKIASRKSSKSKKRKISDSSPAQNGSVKGEKSKSKKKQKMEVNHGNADSDEDNMSEKDESEDDDVSEEDDTSIEYSSEEELNTSAGRTPMPRKKVNSTTALGESPDLQQSHKKSEKKKKAKLNTTNVSSTNKGAVPTTPKNARKLAGNIQVEDLRTGSGPVARNGRFVFLHYVGKLVNGKVFEICEPPKKPFSFRLGKGEVIRGLEIGIEGMVVGGKRKITIPPNMGYGNQKNEQIPANSTLVFIVELKAVN